MKKESEPLNKLIEKIAHIGKKLNHNIEISETAKDTARRHRSIALCSTPVIIRTEENTLFQVLIKNLIGA